MDFKSLDSYMEQVNNDCISLIGEDQRQHIQALEIENQSLSNTLKDKDIRIKQMQDYISAIENKVSKIVDYLKKQQISEDQLQNLENIEKQIDIPTKIDFLFQYTLYNNQPQEEREIPQKDSPSYREIQTQRSMQSDFYNPKQENVEHDPDQEETIGRLRKQLLGHVEFLTRLVNSPKSLNFFLISNESGKTFLDKATRDLMVEQAQRTSELVYMLTQGTQQYKDNNPTISDILGHEINLNDRSRTLSKYLSSQKVKKQMLGDMLLQETVITSILSNSYEAIKERAEDLEEQLAKANNQNKYLQTKRQQNSIQTSPSLDKYFDNRAKVVFDMLNKALNENNTYSKEQLLDSTIRLAQDYLSAQRLSGTKSSYTDYVKQTGESIQDLMNKVKDIKANFRNYKQNQGNNQFNTSSRDTREDSWENWARRVYAGILGIEAKPKNNKDMQIIIEESALTSCGNRQLQRRLESLRNQKKVMTEPNIPSNGRVHFKTLLAVSITVMRMRRCASYRTPSYFRVSPF